MITKQQYTEAVDYAADMFRAAGIAITPQEKESIEVADFGLGILEDVGLQLLVYVNTERCCAKEMVLRPFQTCPEHRHANGVENGVSYVGKEETFRVRRGTCYLYVDGDGRKEDIKARIPPTKVTVFREIVLREGEQYTLHPNTKHWFQAGGEGAVISEFSTKSRDESDLFTDERIKRIPEVEGTKRALGGINMKMMFSILFSVIGATVSAANDTEKKSVFNDVLGYYCGGVDVGGDGVAAPSEVRDIRRLGVADADSHKVAFGFYVNDMTNGIRWVEDDVDCAVAGVTLKKQKCLEFTQVYTKSDGTKADANACFTLPFLDDIGAGGDNMPFTVIMRFRVPDEVRKVDGTVLGGNPVYGGNQGYLFDLGRNPFGTTGISVGIPWDPLYNGICVGIGTGMNQSLLMTNEVYRTKGACWNELALRVPNDIGSLKNGFLLRLFQPGCSARTIQQNINNATPTADKKFIIGNYGNDLRFAFRGKIHMFAVWKRALSDEEIKEAFSTDPAHGLRSLTDAVEAGEKNYVVGKPVFAIGNAEFGNEMFAGKQDSDAVVDTQEPSLASMPARLAVGQKVTFRAKADVYHVGYNSILRFKAADDSSHGVVSVMSGARKLSEIQVVPGQYGSCLVPNTDMSAEELSLTMECVSADETGLAFDMFELGGAFAWSAGKKDGANAEFFGGSQKTLFEVGADPIYRFNRAVSTTVKDRSVLIPLPEDVVSKYGFKLEFAAHSISAFTPLKMQFNGQTIFKDVKMVKDKDYSIRLPRELVAGGVNTLWYTSDNADGESVWVNFDYMRLVPYVPVSLRVIVR